MRCSPEYFFAATAHIGQSWVTCSRVLWASIASGPARPKRSAADIASTKITRRKNRKKWQGFNRIIAANLALNYLVFWHRGGAVGSFYDVEKRSRGDAPPDVTGHGPRQTLQTLPEREVT